MAQYRLVTNWVLEGTTADAAWELLKASNYGDWWPTVKVTVLEPGDADGIGELRESEFTTKLPYKLKFKNRLTKLTRPSLIQLDAFGELEGFGRYDILQEGTRTNITYTWEVSTTKAWMNLIAPLMRPLFEWNHAQVMHEGGVSLAKRLNATLVKG